MKKNSPRLATVITSINAPTKAVARYSKWSTPLFVVGDKKSPATWLCSGVHYMPWNWGADKESSRLKVLDDYIGFNTYGRKMLGYVAAAKTGAQFIFETDDDNIPYANAEDALTRAAGESGGWACSQSASSQTAGWVNMYSVFTSRRIWPRGFPLDLIDATVSTKRDKLHAGIVQYLADGDPDVDAIYRLLFKRRTYFRRSGRRTAVALGKVCPFNSQATLWPANYFPLMFLPIGCSDRVTDILRGLMVSKALQCEGKSIAFEAPIVYQERNAHNLIRDLEAEVPLYTTVRSFIERATVDKYDNAIAAFRALLAQAISAGIIPERNLAVFDCFSSLVSSPRSK